MTVRHFYCFTLTLGLLVLAGCSGGGGGAQQPRPAATRRSEEPKSAPKPPPKPVEPPDAPVKLVLPEKPAVEPWIVGQSPEPGEFAAIAIPNAPAYSVTGLAVRPELNRAIVSIKALDKKGAVTGTRVALCDTAAGKILIEWQLAGEFAVLDFSPDGRMVLATQPGFGRGRETLRLWLLGSDNQIKRWSWVPHDVPELDQPITPGGRKLSPGESVEVRWAAFVGNERIVSMSRGGQLRVFNPDGPRCVATLDASPCRPAITPDGTRVAFLAGETVALLDPVAGHVSSGRDIGVPPPYPALAFSPDGTRLAVGGNGRVVFLEMAGGAARHITLPRLRVTENGILDKSFGWAGAHHLYSDQQLHDPNFTIPVWDFKGAEQGQFRGYQLWLSVRTGGFTSTLRPFILPHLDGQRLLASAKATAGWFTLKPGSGVRIDTTGLPFNKQDEVRATLSARLREVGYIPNDTASVTLLASVDATGTKNSISYTQSGVVVYTRRPARLRLVMNGREMWSDAWAVSPPFYLRVPTGKTIEQYLDTLGVGDPNYDLFKVAPLPSYFPSINAPSGSLGSSQFTADGVKDGPR